MRLELDDRESIGVARGVEAVGCQSFFLVVVPSWFRFSWVFSTSVAGAAPSNGCWRSATHKTQSGNEEPKLKEEQRKRQSNARGIKGKQ